jgi:hypothetical protein
MDFSSISFQKSIATFVKVICRGKINTPDTIIHDRPLSMLGTGNSRKKMAGID